VGPEQRRSGSDARSWVIGIHADCGSWRSPFTFNKELRNGIENVLLTYCGRFEGSLILVNHKPGKKLNNITRILFLTTPSRVLRSSVSSIWSSNLNMINSPISKHCVCHRFGVRCTMYYHRRTSEWPNEATSSVYT
jgi:hypothetical protein